LILPKAWRRESGGKFFEVVVVRHDGCAAPGSSPMPKPALSLISEGERTIAKPKSQNGRGDTEYREVSHRIFLGVTPWLSAPVPLRDVYVQSAAGQYGRPYVWKSIGTGVLRMKGRPIVG
jgi:hypothetical protein